MRKFSKTCLFVTMIVALFNSCKKEDAKNAMDFKITGIANTTIIRNQTLDVNLKVLFLGGNKEEVTLSVQGMPNGVIINFNPVKGEPDFSLTETIHADASSDSGVFPITITGI